MAYWYGKHIKETLRILSLVATNRARTRYKYWEHPPYYHEGRISYKELRKINPEAARVFVLEYLKIDLKILLAK